MKKGLLTLGLILALASPALAGSLELGLNDDSVQIQINQTLQGDGYGSSEGTVRLLYNDPHDTLLGSVGYNVLGELGNVPGLKFGIGGQFYAADAHDRDVLALGLGALVRYLPPAFGGVDVATQVFYAPNIISFADSDRLLESSISLGYQLMPRARVFVGYRSLRVDFDDSKYRSVDSGVVLGARVSF